MSKYDAGANTKADFLMAFWRLYEVDALEDLSISELCRVAGYNRTTFYVYFKNRRELLDRAVDEILQPLHAYWKETTEEQARVDRGKMERLYLRVLKGNGEKLRLLVERGQFHLVEAKAKELIKPALSQVYEGNRYEKELAYLLEYQLSGSFAVLSRWFLVQDMSDREIVHLLVSGMEELLHSDPKAVPLSRDK